MPTPEQLAQAQLVAYNNHDLDAFAACFHPDVTGEILITGQQLFSGMAQLRELYTDRFSLPDLQAQILNRISVGNVVIDHEELVGLVPGETVRVIAIYEIEEDLIRKVRFIREDI